MDNGAGVGGELILDDSGMELDSSRTSTSTQVLELGLLDEADLAVEAGQPDARPSLSRQFSTFDDEIF